MTKKRDSYKNANDAAKKRLADAKKKATKKPVKKTSTPRAAWGAPMVGEKFVPDMYHAMLGIFTAAKVRFRTWKLKTTPGLQEFDGNTIVVGSSGMEPYTTFCFDTTGLLREVTSVSTSDDQQVAVECVGKQTITRITPFKEGRESTHITNPEEK